MGFEAGESKPNGEPVRCWKKFHGDAVKTSKDQEQGGCGRIDPTPKHPDRQNHERGHVAAMKTEERKKGMFRRTVTS